MKRERVRYFDGMRALASIAVVVIHVLGPYRHQIGLMADWDWGVAVMFNSASRWAVPLFIMISGALLLNDPRPFNWRYYCQRRVLKVVVPFLVWSIFYALLSGWSSQGWQGREAWQAVMTLPTQPTYYHLGFFYYFLPLYLVIPFFRLLVQHPNWAMGWIVLWLTSLLATLLRIDGIWSHDLWLYSGYLLLGWRLFAQPLPKLPTWLLVASVSGVVAVTAMMVIGPSLANEKYTVGRWLSYKTLNTALIAAALFVFCQQTYDRWLPPCQRVAKQLSKMSFGIYLIHPLLLWPVREWHWYWGPAWLMILVWSVVILWGTWWLTRWLVSHPRTAWLVP